MCKTVSIEEFLDQSGTFFDVRSPIEYHHAHIPGAHSLPLFSDPERAIVGTLYKKQGKEAALVEGLKFAGPKLALFAEEALKAKNGAKIYCFRGGMRSQSMGWLFGLTGVPCITLKGGYKAFRKTVLSTFEKSYHFKVVGGLTGSGKTAHLKQLHEQGEQTIDLESLAGHRGSAFGALGNLQQTSTEQFENHLAMQLRTQDPSRPIWIEDESRMIGTCKIPDAIYMQLASAPLHLLTTHFEARVERLVKEYGGFDKDALILATKKLTKKLGGAKTEIIIRAIEESELKTACSLLLEYYDATYTHHLEKTKRQLCTLSLPS